MTEPNEQELTKKLADGDDVPDTVEPIAQDELPEGTITAEDEKPNG